jgi:hypothetical protein
VPSGRSRPPAWVPLIHLRGIRQKKRRTKHVSVSTCGLATASLSVCNFGSSAVARELIAADLPVYPVEAQSGDPGCPGLVPIPEGRRYHAD